VHVCFVRRADEERAGLVTDGSRSASTGEVRSEHDRLSHDNGSVADARQTLLQSPVGRQSQRTEIGEFHANNFYMKPANPQ